MLFLKKENNHKNTLTIVGLNAKQIKNSFQRRDRKLKKYVYLLVVIKSYILLKNYFSK